MNLLLTGAAVLIGAAASLGAASCTGCHVRGGNAMGMLQGQPAEKTVREMEAFRNGTRPATLMNRIVRGFSPEEVVQLGTWFSQQ